MRPFELVTLTALACVLAGCAPKAPEPPKIGMPNPASVHCQQIGGKSEIRTSKDGGEYGVCVFNDGRQCNEWPLLRDNRCVAPT